MSSALTWNSSYFCFAPSFFIFQCSKSSANNLHFQCCRSIRQVGHGALIPAASSHQRARVLSILSTMVKLVAEREALRHDSVCLCVARVVDSGWGFLRGPSDIVSQGDKNNTWTQTLVNDVSLNKWFLPSKPFLSCVLMGWFSLSLQEETLQPRDLIIVNYSFNYSWVKTPPLVICILNVCWSL